MDLARQILLHVEADPLPKTRVLNAVDGYTKSEIVEHGRLLIDAGLITARTYRDEEGPGLVGVQLTWAGHEFLDKVRDPEIWRKTKAGAEKAGNWTVKFIGELATGYLRQKAVELGLPIA